MSVGGLGSGGRSLHGTELKAASPLTHLLADFIVGLSDANLPAGDSAAIEEAATSLLAAGLARHAPAPDPVLGQMLRRRVLQFIEVNLKNPVLGPTALMRRFHVSRAHLYRMFAGDGGVTSFIRDQRLSATGLPPYSRASTQEDQLARRTRQDRPVLTFEASQALDEAKEPFFKIEYAIDRLDEEDLISFIAETRRLHAEGSHRQLLQALTDYASAQLAVLEARRSAEGMRYASLEVIRWEPSQRSGMGIASFSEKCEGRDAAVLAARRLLVEHAEKISDEVTVDARISTELEWLSDRS